MFRFFLLLTALILAGISFAEEYSFSPLSTNEVTLTNGIDPMASPIVSDLKPGSGYPGDEVIFLNQDNYIQVCSATGSGIERFELPGSTLLTGMPLFKYGFPCVGDFDGDGFLDLAGREVKMLVNHPMSPGTYRLSFDGKNLATGIYFVRLQTNSGVKTQKIVLLK